MQFEDPGRKSYTVSEFTARVKEILEGRLASVWIEGEVSNHTEAASGHHYFVLKDESSQVRCIMFRQQALYSRFLPENGASVLVHAKVTVYEPRGEYQLVADRIEPLGVGALEMAYRRLKEKLAAEGLFDPAAKRPIPELPGKVGVVTSPAGAAVRDIVKTVLSRSNLVDLLIFPVRVQGEGAAGEIAEAIRALDDERNPWGRLDVIIIGRGGGSLEDLWAFNEEVVARAVYECTTPVISAVGHETDFSISDFVADWRAATPTAAAQKVAPRRAELLSNLESLGSRMAAAVKAGLKNRAERLAWLKRAVPDPVRGMDDRAIRLDELAARMQRAFAAGVKYNAEKLSGLGTRLRMAPVAERIERKGEVKDALFLRLRAAARNRLEQAGQVLGNRGARLSSLNPLAVLERGYAVALAESGEIIKDARSVETGDRVKIVLARGRLETEVKKKEP